MDREADLDGVRLEVTLHFQRNPFARESARAVALRLGRPAELVAHALERLVEQAVLERRGRGPQTLYRYRGPYLAPDPDYPHSEGG